MKMLKENMKNIASKQASERQTKANENWHIKKRYNIFL